MVMVIAKETSALLPADLVSIIAIFKGGFSRKLSYVKEMLVLMY
jgi:hypothetical protein